MLKIEVKSGESIERALKRYKRKYRNTKRLDQIRSRQEYIKKSVERRKTLKKAQYKQKFLNEQEDQ
ncbi:MULTISPECIES: 30S ribosomal protein S21 [Flavobacteriaceae]|uniref:Small ribosomal subunit protein bS21 n=2 Tax=Flavobacteriaceae TaxID=49546 RepID=A0ABS3EYE0_9FLAO|nr:MULTISPECIES: 30S ribosomal protein S21 [Allomuricauda]MBO0331260.1 30S ribosomal protein S21 [[Muricauda] lutisoli]MBO0342442.1 30S ribosomal protein S21 [Allomuricauda profundi]MEC7770727.1 30S ribosomal protein S21 [Bacteroidota bacterium]